MLPGLEWIVKMVWRAPKMEQDRSLTDDKFDLLNFFIGQHRPDFGQQFRLSKRKLLDESIVGHDDLKRSATQPDDLRDRVERFTDRGVPRFPDSLRIPPLLNPVLGHQLGEQLFQPDHSRFRNRQSLFSLLHPVSSSLGSDLARQPETDSTSTGNYTGNGENHKPDIEIKQCGTSDQERTQSIEIQ